MSNRPWMPFYIGDYIADTGHLRTVDHGAYLLLIMHYWRTGGLPLEDAKLAKITRLPLKAWVESVRPAIEPLFLPGWRHKRIDKELEKHEVIRTKRAMAGFKGGTAYHRPSRINASISLANAEQTRSNHSHISKKEAADKVLEASPELQANVRSKLR